MKRTWSLLILVVWMLQVGVIGSYASTSGTSQKSKRNNSALGPQGVVSDSIVNFFSSKKTGKELMLEKKNSGRQATGQGAGASNQSGGSQSGATGAGAVSTASAQQLTPALVKPVVTTSSIHKVYNVPKVYNVQKIAVPPPPAPAMAVPQIRQEIQKILELNQKIKDVRGGQGGQFQRVQEQARIHQKILNEIESSSEGEKKSDNSKAPSKESLLAQEKLRIIHEETQRNAALLSAVGGEDSSLEPVPVSARRPKKT